MNRRPIFAVILFTLLATLAGCQGKIVSANVKNPLTNVCDRHDNYVQNDISVTNVEKSVYVGESGKLREALKESTFKASTVDAELQAVTVRHDAYVEKDVRLIKLEKDIMLRDTALLREIWDRAQQRK